MFAAIITALLSLAIAGFACTPASEPDPTPTPVPWPTATANSIQTDAADPTPTSPPQTSEVETSTDDNAGALGECLAPTLAEPTEREESLNVTERLNRWSAPPEMQIDPTKCYSATFETEVGDFLIELTADKTPTTVNNFVFLAREGYYDNITFHRVIPDFMAQGGDPSGTGRGGPGYTIPDEFDQTLRHDAPGILSMANAGPNTGGSQFFITFVPTPWLDDAHAVFGRVTEGMDVVRAIRIRDPQTDPNPGTLLRSVTITETDRAEG